MMLLSRSEYVLLLCGDAIVFFVSLWLSLAVRYVHVPSLALYRLHAYPFTFIFVVWIGVFFVAGLYGKHTRLFRQRLLTVIVVSQTINIVLAAFFFFFMPIFGIAPKTILALYLVISTVLIFMWRVVIFPVVNQAKPLVGVLLASGNEVHTLAEEVQNDPHYQLSFESVVDTGVVPSHEIVQQTCRAAARDSVSFLVIDFFDPASATILPLMYSAAFQKERFILVDILDLYQEVFERVPLSLVRYEWILRHVTVSRLYDRLKRTVDFACAFVMGIVSLIVYPFVMLAIKIEDGGPIFITQERVGKYQRPIHIVKFRSMSGNDNGDYGNGGTSKLHVTRVGKWIRILRIDELPQLWNVLRGDLSLVGPRPELPALVAQYNARIPYYSARYLVTPGLTGWAQIRHDRDPHHGADINETKMKLAYDLFYLSRRSLVLDIYILFQTIRIVLTARGS
jgi:lipopolysaccharide/colanic/teichoic acid biosynthesis glycosyltransferase